MALAETALAATPQNSAPVRPPMVPVAILVFQVGITPLMLMPQVEAQELEKTKTTITSFRFFVVSGTVQGEDAQLTMP